MTLKTKNPSVAIVIISWNGLEDTLNCLASLQRLDYPNWRAVLVDNGSQDDTVRIVREHFPAIHTIANPSNHGYARGNNQGIRWALDAGADWIMLLNNDVILASDALSEMIRITESDPTIGIVGPVMQRTLRADIQDLGGDLDFRWGRVLLRRREDASTDKDYHLIDYVWGCTLMAKRDIFARTGGLRTFYTAYFEDAELCLAARRFGFKTAVALRAKVLHHVGRSGEKRFIWQTYLRTRNHALFFLRFARPTHWPTLLPSLLLAQLPMILLRATLLYLARKFRRRKYQGREIKLWGYSRQVAPPSAEQIDQWLEAAKQRPYRP
ncbi:MAG: glycosyltransferase family 2 protein [Chloroflexi bacterium]|nr:glycosyltransferase family 2 protein [Chloroflexota bacterium]